jgi:hypothetical protein
MEKITPKQLVPLFEKFAGASFVGLRTKTVPKLNKKGRSSGLTLSEKFGNAQIVKFSEFSAGIGYDYKKSIERKLVKEGKEVSEYVAGESWHVSYNDSKVIRQHKNNGELYFYVSLNSNNGKGKSEFFDIRNGKVIAREEIQEFLPKESAPTNQGVEEGNEVLVRTLKLDSVVSLSACGEVFEVVE